MTAKETEFMLIFIVIAIILIGIAVSKAHTRRMEKLQRTSKTRHAKHCGIIAEHGYAPDTSISYGSDGKTYYTIHGSKPTSVTKGFRFCDPESHDYCKKEDEYKYIPYLCSRPPQSLFNPGTLYYNTDEHGVNYYVGFISDDGTENTFSSSPVSQN